MTQKVKFELEYLLKTSPKILENMLCTPSGLSEWFADDVNVKDDIFTFCWDGSWRDRRVRPSREHRVPCALHGDVQNPE